MHCMSNLFALPKCGLSSVDLMAGTVVLLVIVPLWLAGRFLKNVSLLFRFPLTLLLVPTLTGTRFLPKLSTAPLLFTCQNVLPTWAHILASMSFLARMAPSLMLQKLDAAWSSCWPTRSRSPATPRTRKPRSSCSTRPHGFRSWRRGASCYRTRSISSFGNIMIPSPTRTWVVNLCTTIPWLKKWLTPPFPNKILLKLIMEPLPLLAQPACCMLMRATTIPKAIGMNGLYLVLRTFAVRPTPTFPNKLFRVLVHFCILRLVTGTIGRFLARCTFAARTSSNFDAAARLSMAWQTN
ncbi:unnamed protein product [Prorocentrum cordatum]|uniref:Uncharacterized protein n=1 Tax=Prorocentrum cordatum TaxID=2364126 RepID=A0ABN9TJF5_9DINO|nr:unnamed protein product [Polarella glacialis]